MGGRSSRGTGGVGSGGKELLPSPKERVKLFVCTFMASQTPVQQPVQMLCQHVFLLGPRTLVLKISVFT